MASFSSNIEYSYAGDCNFSDASQSLGPAAPKTIYSRGHCAGMAQPPPEDEIPVGMSLEPRKIAVGLRKLEEKVAELSVCCESCTNRLDKLEAKVAWAQECLENLGYGRDSKPWD